MAAPYEDLLALRSEFPILERTTYLINNSLGAMPRGVHDELATFAREWEERGVRAWSEGWWELSITTGDLLAPLLGVRPGSIAMHQNVAVAMALQGHGHRHVLVHGDRAGPDAEERRQQVSRGDRQ